MSEFMEMGDIERCKGVSYVEDGAIEWREGCYNCLRRTLPNNGLSIEPPAIIVFFCPYLIEPKDIPNTTTT